MIDVNSFLLMLLYILGSVLIVVSIILVIKLINTVNRVNGIMDEVSVKISKFDNAFRFVDVITDNMALVSDKLVDGISYLIRKIFHKNSQGKGDEISE